ncbi:hypothetical protein DFH08DRAFT_676465, partial [Mycena albidolilacea]
MRRRASIDSSDSSQHRRPVLASLLSRKPTHASKTASKSAQKRADSASYTSGDSDQDSSGSHESATLPLHGIKPARRKVVVEDESDVEDTARSQSQKWNPWPDGTWEATYTREYFEQCQFSVHWACEVRGGKKNSVGSSRAKKKDDGAHTLRLCRGVMKCTSATCDILTRPQTKNAGRIAQVQAGCSCGSPLRHYTCDVRIEYWVYRDAVDGPGPSVADISSVLLNPHRIQYERRRILNPHFLPKLERFKEKHPNWTVGVHWVDGINVIVLQSPWQRRMGLKDQIKSEAVNGVVSDACHDYFTGHNHLLFLSSTFEPLHLKSWVPILMTYSNGATAVHYRIHFLYLFRGLAKQCREMKRRVTDDLFANVVDFSDAQRNGFVEAFVDFWVEFAPRRRNENELKEAAAALLKGCRQHFSNQITRVAKISRIVGPERQSRFRKFA